MPCYISQLGPGYFSCQIVIPAKVHFLNVLDWYRYFFGYIASYPMLACRLGIKVFSNITIMKGPITNSLSF